ncbi:MAG TPA: cytochrome c3 family protein [Woeseiaceae bacterium]|nr:cytochrome c3 family protein [Woeseiaceae bacterium]
MAANIEKLVMPGRVTEGHADFENDCGACHDAETDEARPLLCTACHEGIGADRTGGTGFHGRFPAARESDCTACHTEHEGRDADIVGLDGGLFDHAFTDFPLVGAHEALTCSGCHAADASPREAPAECGVCHRADDPHEGQLGGACADCHNQADWLVAVFDHAGTGYALTGGHRDVACGDCHQRNRFDAASRRCVTCHAVDDVHDGSRGDECSSCHTTDGWNATGFDHATMTGFALADGHAGLECADCHRQPDHKDTFAGGCVACHAGDDVHQGRLGTDCAGCHAPDSWPAARFDHDTTGFALEGAHAAQNCTACHKTGVSQAPDAECSSCHVPDDVHDGQLAGDCSACHGQADWADPIRFDHDLADFPLLGMHAAVACAGCHTDSTFRGAPTDCADCHRDDDPHAGQLGEACGACHSSNSWAATAFDHDAVTRFVLDGAHEPLPCTACHADPAADAAAVSPDCGSCHRPDDVHDGQFGTNCGGCHSTRSFGDITGLNAP